MKKKILNQIVKFIQEAAIGIFTVLAIYLAIAGFLVSLANPELTEMQVFLTILGLY